MSIELYSRVRIVTDRFRHEGAPKGSLGYVIEKYDDEAYEIEVSDPGGQTVAQFVASRLEVEPAPENQ